MNHMTESGNKEFFSKLWKCPIRRWHRYGRKLLFVFILGIVIWVSLDFFAIILMKPQNYPPFLSLVLHALLTISVSLILTLITHQLYLRLSSRFRLIRAFQSSRRPPHD
jgi:hypothetical protein